MYKDDNYSYADGDQSAEVIPIETYIIENNPQDVLRVLQNHGIDIDTEVQRTDDLYDLTAYLAEKKGPEFIEDFIDAHPDYDIIVQRQAEKEGNSSASYGKGPVGSILKAVDKTYKKIPPIGRLILLGGLVFLAVKGITASRVTIIEKST